MKQEIRAYNDALSEEEAKICRLLADRINHSLPEAESKIWHAHPVWFLDGNPVVGYQKLKDCVRLLFWSGRSFEVDQLKPNTGKFQDASIRFTRMDQIDTDELKRWLEKSKDIQWDYKNLVKRKGVLKRLK